MPDYIHSKLILQGWHNPLSPDEMPTPHIPARTRISWRRVLLYLIFTAMVGLGGILAGQQTPTGQASPGEQHAVQPTFTESPSQTLLIPVSIPTSQISTGDQGAILYSRADGLNYHLFAYLPGRQPAQFIQLTKSPWDDIHPAVSADGKRIAYSSQQNGYWDIYILDIQNGAQTRVTDSPEYDGHPTWSPDGMWLAYDSYIDGHLQIMLVNLGSLTDEPIQMTAGEFSNHSPSWSPGGREIAFVSDRSGSADIWLSRLDQADERFINLTPGTGGEETHPDWSPDGKMLAWSSDAEGSVNLYVWETSQPLKTYRRIGSGNWPIWNSNGTAILTSIMEPNAWGLAGYMMENAGLMFPFIEMTGSVEGLDWLPTEAVNMLSIAEFPSSSKPDQALSSRQLNNSDNPPRVRAGLVEINNIDLEYPYIQEAVEVAFTAFRTAAGAVSGWDVLGNLEAAYLPITEPSGPGISENWLFTGRAFNLNPVPVQAGWMVVLRENFGGQVYWRVFVKARYQDGSQGRPLDRQPWNLDARNSGEPRAYEQGGAPSTIPTGYWIDLTDLGLRYGWERPAALQNWRTFYPAARFNQFFNPGGLDWAGAMAELYPPEAIQPPTAVPTLTLTPTIGTHSLQNSATPVPSATIAREPTRRPTWTPLP